MPSTINATPTSSGLVQSADASGVLALQTGGTTAVTIDGSQNVGIGTESPAVKFDVTGTVVASGLNARITNTDTDASARAAIQFKTGASANVWQTFAIGGNLVTGIAGVANFMTLGSDGAISAGSTTGTVGLGVFSNFGSRILDFSRYADDGATVGFRRGATVVGNISVTGSATAYNTSSDYRLKENIAPMAGALGLVQQLKPVTYNWKVDGSIGQGFIAHELAEVVPQAVTGVKDALDKDGNPEYQGIDVSFLVATLTAAIQEQQALITQLQADVAALKVQP